MRFLGIRLGFDGDALTVDADIGAAVSAAAQRVAENARGLCPVDTGRLKNSIAVSVGENGAQVSAGTDYAAYVEFGTSRAAAQPFLVPALLSQDTVDAFLEKIYD